MVIIGGDNKVIIELFSDFYYHLIFNKTTIIILIISDL